MKIIKLLLFFIIATTENLFAQKNNLLRKTDWNAYAQIRFTTNFNNNYNFSLHRLKLWLKSAPDFSEHWSYKIQTTLSGKKNEIFFLQDVKLGYKTGNFSLDIGQFVPEYSLERFEADFLLPTIERAKVIDCLIPNGTLGVRDIGIQVNIKTKNNFLHSYFGIFNGYGIKEYRLNNKGVMLTNKTAVNFNINNSKIETGYSAMYRKADMQILPEILSDTVSFSGNDFSYNLFVKFKSKYFEIQGEYLTAFIGKQKAEGYYILSDFNFGKHQIVFAFEDYKDLISETPDLPYYLFGYNYSFNKYKLKLFFDNFFQIYSQKIKNYTASVQLQLFFKQ